ncbi:hypothetical protein XBJ2_440090 [Xenorhabdus bovienii str. Jollieti]|uniref:Uncharacterized protein n=1 Tax=Xenorhabdus bovienii (strain SS-2004) TaxID=406818 RepID=D3UZS9_XENBS|nr:hypothetical protein XBJ1_1021 [Xenorhabdus bovienii SS-2004]CDH29873.1 hypothetical protein XBJ2_440090 [Xenorhabdus bovienii str. Jollieti]
MALHLLLTIKPTEAYNFLPLHKRNQTHTAPFTHQLTDHLCLIWIASLHRSYAAQSPRNKRKPDVKRTTPHPPARFGSKNYFSFKIRQREPPERASTGGVREIAN